MNDDGVGEFRVETVQLDGTPELRLVGELDMGTARRLAQALEPVLSRRVDTVVFDMSQLRFIDSSGLHQLVTVLKHQRAIGGGVVLRSPTDHTRRVLEIAGVAPMFTIT